MGIVIAAATVTNFLTGLVGVIAPAITGLSTIGILVSLGLMAIHHHNAPTLLKTSIGALVLGLLAQPIVDAIVAIPH